MIVILPCPVNLLNLRFAGLPKLLMRALPMHDRSAGDGAGGMPEALSEPLRLLGLSNTPIRG